jgi:hypothetical protein
MDQELRSMLETIVDHQEAMKEEMNARFETIVDHQEAMKEEMNTRFETIQKDMNVRFDGVDGRLEVISSQLDRIEAETNDDVVAILESISSKMETLATKEDIDYLAGRLGKHELEIDRLKRIK